MLNRVTPNTPCKTSLAWRRLYDMSLSPLRLTQTLSYNHTDKDDAQFVKT